MVWSIIRRVLFTTHMVCPPWLRRLAVLSLLTLPLASAAAVPDATSFCRPSQPWDRRDMAALMGNTWEQRITSDLYDGFRSSPGNPAVVSQYQFRISETARDVHKRPDIERGRAGLHGINAALMLQKCAALLEQANEDASGSEKATVGAG